MRKYCHGPIMSVSYLQPIEYSISKHSKFWHKSNTDMVQQKNTKPPLPSFAVPIVPAVQNKDKLELEHRFLLLAVLGRQCFLCCRESIWAVCSYFYRPEGSYFNTRLWTWKIKVIWGPWWHVITIQDVTVYSDNIMLVLWLHMRGGLTYTHTYTRLVTQLRSLTYAHIRY